MFVMIHLTDHMLSLRGRAMQCANMRNSFSYSRTIIANPLQHTVVSKLSSKASCNAASSDFEPAASSGAARSVSKEEEKGIRFVFEPPRTFVLKAARQRRNSSPTTVKVIIDESLEGQPFAFRSSSGAADLESFAQQLSEDARLAIGLGLIRKAQLQPKYKLPRMANVSLVLCDDPYIRGMNLRHRGMDSATDVLSFEMKDEMDYKVHMPMKLLGDLVVSLDTAARQAEERGYTLLDESRVLIVHGLLHLLGFDHEQGVAESEAMAAEERWLLDQLGWKGVGLITCAESAEADEDEETPTSTTTTSTAAVAGNRVVAPVASLPRARLGPSVTSSGADSGFLWSSMLGMGGNEGPASSSSSSGSGGSQEGNRSSRRSNAGVTKSDAEFSAGKGSKPAGSNKSSSSSSSSSGSGSSSKAATNNGSSTTSSATQRSGQSAAKASTGTVAPPSTQSSKTKSNSGAKPSVGSEGNTPQSQGAQSSPARRPLVKALWVSSAPPLSSPVLQVQTLNTCRGSSSDTHFSSGSNSSSSSSLGCHPLKSGSRLSVLARSSYTTDVYANSTTVRGFRSSSVRLVALDMDGTLLDSSSRIRPSSVQAIQAAISLGVRVVLATGKARPAAIRAAGTVGLAGPSLLVDESGPGIFLQGLAVHGGDGRQLSNSVLPPAVVRAAALYSLETGISMCAFLGDTCATLAMTPELEQLHSRYYEPLAQVLPSVEALLAGPPVRKLLFFASPDVNSTVVAPYWKNALVGQGADLMMAVPDCLELVPAGVNKWVGVQILLPALGVDNADFMAVGDGSNDLEMVAHAGVGVAMGNAVDAVKQAAFAVVSSNNEDGVAQAFERYVL